MAATFEESGMPDGFVRLAASLPLRSDPGRVAKLLTGDNVPWRAARTTGARGGRRRRYAIDLRVRLGGESTHLATFHKAAYLDLGDPQRTADGWRIEIAWRASSAAPLFPVFSGWLTVGSGVLTLDGLYAPPGGTVGRIADRVLLHMAANATARQLLEEIDRAALEASALLGA